MSSNILFLIDPLSNLARRGCLNDYMSDAVFHGLHGLLKERLCYPKVPYHLFKTYNDRVDIKLLWGRGFTMCWLIEDNAKEESDVVEKITDRYYDFIIYGNIDTCQDHYELVSKVYPKNRVIIIDGTDQPVFHQICEDHLYFKRELLQPIKNILPISFAIPQSKIATDQIVKSKLFATSFPGNTNTYVFKHEKDYYMDYKSSFFAFTMKKAGWDCLRHYEILANRCVPLFYDLSSCPNMIMTTFPKDLCKQAIHLFSAFDVNRYIELENQFYRFTMDNLTTKSLAEYILTKI
jgi:hypothetical protein